MKEILRLHGEEFRDLENMLAVLRNGGWFGRWLVCAVNLAARSAHRTEKYPTPLEVMQSLTLDNNGEFQDALQAAKEIAEQRPDLLFPAPPQSRNRCARARRHQQACEAPARAQITEGGVIPRPCRYSLARPGRRAASPHHGPPAAGTGATIPARDRIISRASDRTPSLQLKASSAG
ncbi:MAG: hypothetical protein JWO19_2663 [Bryobacterales bacterium]|nr:hypothetical protein [Bryobacterales bacterium]